MSTDKKTHVQLEGWFSDSSPRGLNYTKVFDHFSSGTLKNGFALQFLSLIVMTVTNWMSGNFSWYTSELLNLQISDNGGVIFYFLMALEQFAYLLGVFCICVYQAFLSDTSKFARGYRIGSKFLAYGAWLGLLANIQRFVNYCYAFSFYQSRWWSRYSATRFDVINHTQPLLLDGFSLAFTGAAILLLEVFHDEGTVEAHNVWKIATLFVVAGKLQILYAFSGFGSYFSVLKLAGLSLALFWANDFERVVELSGPTLHSRDLQNNVVPKWMNSFSGGSDSQPL